MKKIESKAEKMLTLTKYFLNYVRQFNDATLWTNKISQRNGRKATFESLRTIEA